MIRSALFAITVISITQAADSPALFSSPSEQTGFEWLLDTASRNADYAARRKAAGKPEESALILYSLSEFLDLTHPEIDLITIIAAKYKDSYSNLLAECRLNEIVWKRSHPSSPSGYPTWTASGFPVNFLARKSELQKDASIKLRAELGESKFLYLKQNCYRLLAPSYGGTIGKPITK